MIYFAQAAVLTGLVLWAYAPGLNSQFQLDDGRIIVGNVYIRTKLAQISSALLSIIWPCPESPPPLVSAIVLMGEKPAKLL